MLDSFSVEQYRGWYDQARGLLASMGVSDADLRWFDDFTDDFDLGYLDPRPGGMGLDSIRRYERVQQVLMYSVSTGEEVTMEDLLFATCQCGLGHIGIEASMQFHLAYEGRCHHPDQITLALTLIALKNDDKLSEEFDATNRDSEQGLMGTLVLRGLIVPDNHGWWNLTKTGAQLASAALRAAGEPDVIGHIPD